MPYSPSPSPYHPSYDYGDEFKEWLQENLSVIVSIFIVGAIALGIYSYSQTEEPKESEPVEVNCESYGKYSRIDDVPLRCKKYWQEKIN